MATILREGQQSGKLNFEPVKNIQGWILGCEFLNLSIGNVPKADGRGVIYVARKPMLVTSNKVLSEVNG